MGIAFMISVNCDKCKKMGIRLTHTGHNIAVFDQEISAKLEGKYGHLKEVLNNWGTEHDKVLCDTCQENNESP